MHLFNHTANLTPEMLPGIVAENPPQQVSPIHVNARWLSDLELFNEWPNEEDYLMAPISQVELGGRTMANTPGLSEFSNTLYRTATPNLGGYLRQVR